MEIVLKIGRLLIYFSYSFCALFILAHFVLGFWNREFTPILWNSCFHLLVFTSFFHLWYHFYRQNRMKWTNAVGFVVSLPLILFLDIFIWSVLTWGNLGGGYISFDYSMQDRELVFHRGFLHGSYDEYHELLNPYIMEKAVLKEEYFDW